MKAKSNILWIGIALVAALFCRTFLISVYKIPTVSMAPTFWPGDFIVSSQIAYGLRLPLSNTSYFQSTPKTGDLVVFQFTAPQAISKVGAQYVKRIVALGGDEIEIQNGHMILNGKPCSYTKVDRQLSVDTFQVFNEECDGSAREIILSSRPDKQGALSTFARMKVPLNEVFVLGENRDTSDDSRDLGTVPVDQIASKVSSIWLSYGSTQDFISGSNVIRWNRILTKPR